MRVFLYGTLLDPGVFRRQAGTLRPWRRALPARLDGFRRVTLRGTPYPTLLRGAGVVRGVLVMLPAEPLARLATYEGRSYGMLPVRVVTAYGPRWARAWTAARWRADPRRCWSVFPTHAGM